MRSLALLKLLLAPGLTLCCALATLAAQSPVHHTGIVHTPEVDLAYETFGTLGKATPVIAVNGGPGLSHAYMMQNDLWQKVAAKRFVLLYDQRGTGGSKHMQPGAPLTGDAQVADLEAIRAKLGAEKVYLVGDSYGGALVMAYGAAHPEHVAKMVLSDSAPPSLKDFVHLLPQTFPDYEEKGEAEEKALAKDPAAAAQAGLVNHFRMIFYAMEKRDQYMAHMGDIGFEPAVAEAIEKSGADYDLNPAIVKFHFPTLVITGRYDMNVAPIVSWKLAHEIPGAQIVFFEKSGHLPAYEEPEKYLKVLEDFFGAN